MVDNRVNFASDLPDYSSKYTDFIVGDRVWVDGFMPGYIQFIGETHFADGDWAGIVLDEPIGRNAGSVQGRRYFYCEPKRGLFARLHRLSKYPYSGKFSPDSGIMDDKLTSHSSRRSFRLRPASSSPTLYERYRSRSSSRYREDSSPIRYDSLNSSPERYDYYAPTKTMTRITTATTTLDSNYRPGPLTIGDKVFVNSVRGLLVGRLQYLGETDFAYGDWAGVELEKPLGRNDGRVEGKRYFTCRPYYGLFVPLHKVVKADPNRVATFTRTISRPHF